MDIYITFFMNGEEHQRKYLNFLDKLLLQRIKDVKYIIFIKIKIDNNALLIIEMLTWNIISITTKYKVEL